MRGEPRGWGGQVSGNCRPGGTAFSDTLRTAFTYGYDWLGRELSRSPGPDGGSDMHANGQVVHYGGNLPGLSQVLLRGENGSLYLFDGTTSTLVANGPLRLRSLFPYPSRGQTFIRTDEALIILSRAGTRLMPLPRESYGSFSGFLTLEDGSVLAVDGRTAARIKNTAVQPLSTRMPPGAQPMDVPWNPSAADANRLSVQGDDGLQRTGRLVECAAPQRRTAQPDSIASRLAPKHGRINRQEPRDGVEDDGSSPRRRGD